MLWVLSYLSSQLSQPVLLRLYPSDAELLILSSFVVTSKYACLCSFSDDRKLNGYRAKGPVVVEGKIKKRQVNNCVV